MGNIKRLFLDDLHHVADNVIVTVLLIGIITIPAFGAWFNILAAWDVFDKSSNLPVAVANLDDGYTADRGSIQVNIGDDVIESLEGDSALNWTFTSEDDAIEGVRSGKYYAAVVIPENTSERVMAILSGENEPVPLDYYSNQKKSVVAKKVIDQKADEMSLAVNRAFSERILEAALGSSSTILDVYDSEGLEGYAWSLMTRLDALSGEMRATGSTLRSYAIFLGSAQELMTQSRSMIANVRKELSEASRQSEDALNQARDMEAELRQASEQLSDLASKIDAALDESLEAAKGALGRSQGALDGEAPALRSQAEGLRAQEEALGTSAEGLKRSASLLDEAAEKLASAEPRASADYTGVLQRLEEADKLFESAQATYKNEIVPVVAECSQTLIHASEALKRTIDEGDATLGNAMSATRAASDSLAAAVSPLTGAADELEAAAESLDTLSAAIRSALDSDDIDLLRRLGSTGAAVMASLLSAPIQLDRMPLFPSENFGSALTPLYSLLPLWIGTVLIMVTLNVFPDPKELKALKDPSPQELFVGRFGIIALVSLMQSTVMAVGFLAFLQVHVVNPALFLLTFWIVGLAFSAIVYTLVALLMSLGKAICVLLLVTQVSGSGGSFPVNLLPEPLQFVSPVLPATHAIGALREAMFGAYGEAYWIELGLIVLIGAIVFAAGIAPRGYIDRFIKWLFGAVSKTKLM